MNQERFRPFVVTTLVGCVLWCVSGGMIHAYIICPDWGQITGSAMEELSGMKPFLSLVIIGLLFGLAIEIAKFGGAVLHSEAAVMLAPIIVGTMVGIFQGSLVPTDFWGFDDSIAFRSETTRIVSGAVCGFILTIPTIMIGIKMRLRGQPW